MNLISVDTPLYGQTFQESAAIEFCPLNIETCSIHYKQLLKERNGQVDAL